MRQYRGAEIKTVKIAAVITDNTPCQDRLRQGCYPFWFFTDLIGAPYSAEKLKRQIKLDWTNIVSAVLAGGIAGQVVTLLWGSRLAEKREFNKWVVAERYKLYSELLSVVTHTPKEQEMLDKWTYSIRDISLRIHILFPEGVAPKDLAESIEAVFQLARAKKKGDASESRSKELRDAVQKMRKHMAANIQVK